MGLVNYWSVIDEATGRKPKHLQDVGSQAEVKGQFMAVKRKMQAEGWRFEGSWEKKRYVLTRRDERKVWVVDFVHEWDKGG